MLWIACNGPLWMQFGLDLIKMHEADAAYVAHSSKKNGTHELRHNPPGHLSVKVGLKIEIHHSPVHSSRREEIIIYECTSHPSNIKAQPLKTLLSIHVKWPQIDYCRVFKANSNVNSTWKSNLHDAYYFKALMLDEREVRSYTTLPYLQRSHVQKCMCLCAVIVGDSITNHTICYYSTCSKVWNSRNCSGYP